MVQKLTDYLLQNPLYSYGQQQAAYGANPTPVYSPWQGLAKALQGGVGGLFQGIAMAQARGEMEADRKNLATALQEKDPDKQIAILGERPGNADAIQSILLGKQTLANQQAMAQYNQDLKLKMGQAMANYAFGSGSPPAAGGAPTDGGDGGPYAGAIAGIESRGQPNGGYGALGPVTPSGDRAYGKYQVMGTNVGPWAKEILGQEVTPQQFLANPQMQDAVFKGKFGQYAQKYGPEGAARAWFAGESGMNNPNARDQNGMSVAQYGARFSGGMPQGIAQGSSPAVAPGQPQQALNSQPGTPGLPPGFTMFQGVPVPAGALQLARAHFAGGDVEGGLKALDEAVKAGAAYVKEGPTLERVRQADGSEVLVPRTQAAGMTSARETPLPGNKEADIQTLMAGDPRSAEYAQAHARLSQPQMSQGGHLLYPDMSTYRPPIVAGQPAQAPNPTFRDTPASNFDMEEKMRASFSKDPAVENYLQVKPVMEAMQAVKNYPSKAADDNLIAGLVNLYAPGTGSLPREAMFKKLGEVENIPDAVRTTLRNALSSTTGMDEHSRQILLDMAQSRLTPMLNEFNARVSQYGQIAKDRGIDPSHILVMPSASPAREGGGAGKPEPPAGFKLVTPGG